MMSKFMKRVVLPVLIATVFSLGFVGCAKQVEATENEVVTTDSLREEYVLSVGAEYEDTLIMDFQTDMKARLPYTIPMT